MQTAFSSFSFKQNGLQAGNLHGHDEYSFDPAWKIAFGKTEVMNCIQQVGFAYAIASANANNAFSKAKFLVKIIFKLKK